MSDLPRHGVTRAARLARLPVGYAGRTALGSGKRLGGRSAELVTREIQQDSGPHRSEIRYGSLARTVRLPARVDAADVTARYDKGILEVSVPVPAVKPEGTRIPVQDVDAIPEQPPDLAG